MSMNGVAAVIPKTTPPRRMTLAAVKRGRVDQPYRILVHAPDGVGKSTFASRAPAPIFICPEDGISHLDVASFRDPQPSTWQDILDCIRTLETEPHEYRTLVVDTVDWAEPLLWADICHKTEVPGIEDVGGGFGKGYQAALDGWRVFIAALERLQSAKKMNVVLLAHSFIKAFKNPQGADWDRYILKMHEKSASLLREWTNGVYFANYETFADTDKKTKRVRGISTGARLLYTQRTAAYDAKDRYGLPEQLPLDWTEFEARRAAGPARLKALAEEVERKANDLGGDFAPKALAFVKENSNDAQALEQINSRLNALLAEKAEQTATPTTDPAAATAA